MAMPRKAMQALGFQACCLRCDADDAPGLERCTGCIQHHRSVRETLAAAPPDDPLFQLAKEIMAMAASPERYTHDDVHGDVLVQQQRLAGALVAPSSPLTGDDVASAFQARRNAPKTNILRDVANQNPWKDKGFDAHDAKSLAETTWSDEDHNPTTYGARTVPSKPIQPVDRSDRLGEDTALTDRVHAAASTDEADEETAEIFEAIAFKERQWKRSELKSAMDDIKEMVDDDLEF